MRHSTLNPAEREADLARLDQMIAVLEPADAALLKEHLQSARQYLLGAMPEEFGQSGVGEGRVGYGVGCKTRGRLKIRLRNSWRIYPAARASSVRCLRVYAPRRHAHAWDDKKVCASLLFSLFF